MSKTTNLSALSDVVSVDGSNRLLVGTELKINGGNIINPNTSGSEITSATVSIGSNIHFEERQPNGAYSDRTDLVLKTNQGYGLGERDQVRIDSAGRVTMPYQPSFLAIDAAYRTSSGEINAGVVQHNIGGHYNPSTGRFTAPVSGSYVFSFSTLLYTMGSPSTVTLHINGSNTIGLSSYGVYGSFTGTYAGQGASHTIYLNVGDYASFYLANSGTNLHGNYTAISGHLIG